MKKLLLILFMTGKLTIYLFILKGLLFSSVLAFDAKGQYKNIREVSINVEYRNSTLMDVITDIEQKTDYSFQYFEEHLDSEKKINLRKQNITVADLLYKVSEQTNLKFRQVNNNIAITERKKREKNVIVAEQDKVEVTGQVTDEKGESIPGVTILVRGSAVGTSTDINGNYALEVESNAILVFSFVGYETEEINVKNLTSYQFDLVMYPEITALQEIVIMGYSEIEKRKLTESVSVVESEKIQYVPLASFDELLQGTATGVQVVSGGGQPGGGVSVRIRGVNSITGSNAPLYVVDGVPINVGDLTEDAITGNGFSSINPNDIATISVLKDASATSIYGSRGTNGVIIITTKKGRPGRSKIRFNAQGGVSDYENPNNYGVMNANEFTSYMREATINAGIDPDAQFLPNGSPNPDYFPFGDTINTNWVDEVLRQGITQRYDLSVSGGSEKTQYYTSLGYYDEDGIVKETDFRRISARFNFQHAISKKASVGANLSFSDVNQQNRQGGGTSFRDPIYGSFYISPLEPIYASPEQIAAGEDYGTGFNFDIPGFSGHNTVASLALNTNNVQTFRTIANIYTSIDIIDDLIFKVNLGMDRVDIKEDEFLSPNYEKGRSKGASFEGSAIANSIIEFDWNSTITLQYNKIFADKHDFSILAGNELIESRTERNRAAGAGFASDKLQTNNSAARPDDVDSDWTKWSLVSFFGKVNYNYLERYFLNLSIRGDGSSRFGPDNRWGTFWSVGGAWVISNESFLSNAGFIDILKLRAGVGTQGNNNIGNFSWLTDYAYTANLNFNGQAVSGNRPVSLGDSEITWENQFTTDVAIDMSFLNRVNFSVGYYHKRITDMLFDVPLSRTTGFNNLETNAGEMVNQGWEVELNTVNVQKGNFTWSTDFQFTNINNEIVDIPNGEEFVDSGDQEINREGESVNSWYMPRWAGVDPATGKPLWYDENDNITDNYGEANFTIVGQQVPKFYGTLGNTFSYKGLSLSFSFYYNYGNDIYREVQRFLSSDGARFGRNQDRMQLGRWQKPGDIADVPRIYKGNGDGGNNHSDRYLEDGSFIKLRTALLAYNFPQKWMNSINVRNLRVYLQGFNLVTWTKFRGMDPEVGIGSRDFGVYPNPRKILIGLDFEF